MPPRPLPLLHSGCVEDFGVWVYAHLPADEYPATRAQVDQLGSVSQKALYDTAVEAVISAIERAAGGG
ncbi:MULTISPECIES: hypothetical protein [unclassified Streptomyces]|uniref:hypothetical protein n=1 Tax=unclassified Streptomyces TaxID=2593676 RepID=UPI003629E55B